MNFSFSEMKTSIDKSNFFDKNILHTDNPNNHHYNNKLKMLEKISQEDDEDNETVFKSGCRNQNDYDRVQYESDDNDYTSPKLMQEQDSRLESSNLLNTGKVFEELAQQEELFTPKIENSI